MRTGGDRAAERRGDALGAPYRQWQALEMFFGRPSSSSVDKAFFG